MSKQIEGKVHSISRRVMKRINQPNHFIDLPRLNKISGQIDGIEKMIRDGRYCIEIVQQIKAARSAMLSLENAILKRHLENCVQSAFGSAKSHNSSKKIDEIIELLER